MAKRLSQNAVDHLEARPVLSAELAEELEIRNASFSALLSRGSERMLRYDILSKIAESMGVDPLDIIVKVPAKIESVSS